MNSPFVIKIVYGEYYHWLCDVYSVKRVLKYRRNIPVSFTSADRSPSTNGVSSQEAAGFTDTGDEYV